MTRKQTETAEAEAVEQLDPERMQVDECEWRHASSSLFDEVEDALLEMAAANNARPVGGADSDRFALVRTPDALAIDLGATGGRITLSRSVALQQLSLDSHSGTFNFAYNPVTREWTDPHTGTEVRGLLTRDLLAVRKGVPGPQM